MPAPYVCARCSRALSFRQTLRFSRSTQHRQYSFVESARESYIAHKSSPVRDATSRGSKNESWRKPVNTSGKIDDLPELGEGSAEPLSAFVSEIFDDQPGPDKRPPVKVRFLEKTASRQSPSIQNSLKTLVIRAELEKAWALFQRIHKDNASGRRIQASFQELIDPDRITTYESLANSLIDKWTRGIKDGEAPPLGIPSPQELIQEYHESGLASPMLYLQSCWKLVYTLEVCMLKGQKLAENTRTQEALQQLAWIWPRMVGFGTESAVSHTSQEDDIQSRPAVTLNVTSNPVQGGERRQGFVDYVRKLPAFIIFEGNRAYKACRTITFMYDLLSNGRWLHDQPLSEAFPEFGRFVEEVDSLLDQTKVNGDLITSVGYQLHEAEVSQEAISEMVLRVTRYQVQSSSHRLRRPAKPTEALQESTATPAEKRDRLVSALARALARQDLDLTDHLWSVAVPLLQKPDIKNLPKEDLMKVYERFMYTFLTMRRPQHALEVWNAMVKDGYEPTVQTWTVMMKGCHMSRDVRALEAMWKRMRASGIAPDISAWSVRIYGLFRCNDIGTGFAALNEISHEWQTAQQSSSSKPKSASKVKGTPKPDNNILNPALAALASQGRQFIPKVLAWARSNDIQADLITYNVLINVSLANDQPQEALALLRQMSTNGVEPDSATFTILINSMLKFEDMKSLSQQEQDDRVFSLISGIESTNLKVDARTYALLIDRVLKSSANMHTAQRVIAHMKESQGLEPTAYIYTILMTHYFHGGPEPDLDAVNNLWEKITQRPNYRDYLDIIFYDRMVEGYAAHGQIGPMMTYLTQMGKDGKRPGWLALAAVVKCLVEKGEWNRAKEIVEDAKTGGGVLRGGVRGTKGQFEFWEMVRELGLPAGDSADERASF